MNSLMPSIGDQRSMLELWTLVCWLLILLVGLGSATAIACIIGLFLAAQGAP